MAREAAAARKALPSPETVRAMQSMAEMLPPMETVRAAAAAVEALPPMEHVQAAAATVEALPRMEAVWPMTSFAEQFSRTMAEAARPMASITEQLSRTMNEALRSMTVAVRPLASITEELSRTIAEVMRPLESISEALSQVMEQMTQPATTLLTRLRESVIAFYRSLRARAMQLAARMRSDPRPELTHAGHYLERAWEDFADGLVDGRISGDESYEAADAISKAVGATEELVCRLARSRRREFRRSVDQLVKDGILSKAQAHELRGLYDYGQPGPASHMGLGEYRTNWRGKCCGTLSHLSA